MTYPAPRPLPIGRQRWPGWAGPILGAMGGAITGMAVLTSTEEDISPAIAILGPGGMGLLGGLIVWFLDRRRAAQQPASPPLSPMAAAIIAAETTPAPEPSRWVGLYGTLFGIALLLANHALVIWQEKKYFLSIFAGSACLTTAWLRAAWPELTAPAAMHARPAWLWALEAGCVLAGTALAAYLWFVAY